MAITSKDLTIDYRTIMSMPPSTRRQLIATGSVDLLLGVLTPGQRVALFPDYFKQQLNTMAGQRSEFSVNAPRTAGTNIVSLPANIRPQVETAYNVGNNRAAPTRQSSFGTNSNQKAANLVLKLQRDLGLSKIQAAAIAGNFAHESGNFQSLQEIKPVAGRGGYGWAQWTGPRRRNFENWVASQGLNPSSDEANYGFFLHEIQNDPYEKNQFETWREQQYDSIESATQGFETYYERAGVKHYDSRIDRAKQAYSSAIELEQSQTADPVLSESAKNHELASISDDTRSVTGEDASAVPEAVMRTGGIPYPAAMSAVDRALEANGLHERGNKELLKKYLKGQNLDNPASQAWCAAFVNASLASAGLKGTGSNIANSFQTYGAGVDDPSQTQKGDIVVRTNGRGPGETGGHVMMATGNTRVNPETGAFEIEIVGGNQSSRDFAGEGAVAVSTKYVNPQELVIRRSIDANLAGPPPGVQADSPKSTGAEPVQTTAAPPAPQTDESATPSTEVTRDADAKGVTPTQEADKKDVYTGLVSSPTDMIVGAISNWWNKKPEEAKPQLASVSDNTKPSGVPTSSMAYGGVLSEPHTAINNRTGERVNIGEVGTGGEAIVPMNKVRANEVGQQPYQMPQMPQQDARIPKQADLDRKESMPKNATGQTPTPSMPIMVDHQMIPPSARKAYADAGLEGRFNNFSSIGTQYRSFGI